MARVVVVGPGAMGCLHAALLARAGVDVALLDHRPDRARRLADQGLVLWHAERAQRVRVAVTADPSAVAPGRFLVLMVKAYDTAAAAEHALPAASESAVWVTLQNGLGNVEALARVVPGSPVLAGVTTSGANLRDEGQVNVAALGSTVVGPIETARVGDAEEFAGLWREAGLEVTVTADPWPAIWRKLIVNAAINPVASLAGRPNGEVMTVPSLRRLAFGVAREVAAVARAEGVDVGELGDPTALVEQVCELTALNRCSMLQDLEAGRRTEIEHINGEMARRAGPGAPAPLCEALTTLVRAVEGGPRENRQHGER